MFCLLDSALGPDCTSLWLTNSLEFCRAAAAKNDRGEKAEEIIGFGCRERIWQSSVAKMCSHKIKKLATSQKTQSSHKWNFLQTGWRDTIQVERFRKPHKAPFLFKHDQSWAVCHSHMDFCTPSLPKLSQMPEKLKPSSPTAKCAPNAKGKYLPEGSGVSTQSSGIRTFVEEERCGISFLVRKGKNYFQADSFI